MRMMNWRADLEDEVHFRSNTQPQRFVCYEHSMLVCKQRVQKSIGSHLHISHARFTSGVRFRKHVTSLFRVPFRAKQLGFQPARQLFCHFTSSTHTARSTTIKTLPTPCRGASNPSPSASAKGSIESDSLSPRQTFLRPVSPAKHHHKTPNLPH